MSEDSRFVIIKSDVSYAHGVLDMQTRQVAGTFSTLDGARRAQQKCLDGQTQCLWWLSLSKFVRLHGDWSVVPDKPDQLLPTRADFEDDSVPSGDAGPPTQTPVYAVNVDLPELASDLTVDMDKYITYTDANSDSSVDKRRDTYIDCLQQGASLGAVCDHVPSGEVKPSGDIVARSKGTLRCPGVPTPRFSILQSADWVRTYAVLDRINHVVAFTAYANRAVEILKDAQLNPSQAKKHWCWTPFIHSEEYIEMTEEEIRLATQTIDEQEPRYVIVQANNDRRSYAVWDQDKCRMAPVTTLTRVVEMWQQCVDGTDIEFCWITVDQFEKSYGDWSVITQLGEVVDTTTTGSCVGTGCESPTGVFTDAQVKPTTGHRHLDTPLYGDKTPWSMATITSGPYAGKDVVISFEFADGWCVVDLGDSGQGDEGACIVHIDWLRLWVPVRSVVVRDGQTWFDPIQTKGLE